jgi:inosine-uridine nucleoside N-ribohydrolase
MKEASHARTPTTTAIHIDTDPGADDLLALSIALASPELDPVGITTVAGNAPLDAVTDNARRFLALAQSRIPVGHGADRPLRASTVTAAHIHGVDGRHGVPLPPPGDLPSEEATTVFRRSLEERGARTILALGPLTNLARLLEEAPDLLGGTEVVWMGGTRTAGNVTPVAEFNCYVDPDAAEAVLASGLPMRIVGLDVTRRVALRPADVPPDRFGSGPRASMLTKLLDRLMEAEGKAHGERSAILHDPCAVAAILAPRHFRFEACGLAVRLGTGQDRGQLIPVDGARSATIRYAADVDAKAVVSLCLERLQRFAVGRTADSRVDPCALSH